MKQDKSYFDLIKVIHLLLNNKEKEAKKKVQKLILNSLDVDTENEKLLTHIFATALLKRIDRDFLNNTNIYLQKFDVPQIELFYKMTKAYPLVADSHKIANQYILSKIKNMDQVTIFDIGIGKGKQLDNLIHIINQKKFPIKKMNIIGLDPDEVNLKDCQNNFENLSTDFTINFFPICNFLENFKKSDYQFIKKKGNGKIIINAAYSLHHINHDFNDNNERTYILTKLRDLDPKLFTLIEPNSDHDTENLLKRTKNCWSHFSTVFKLIDESDINLEHKFLIKEKFFGREIRDIFGTSDYLRSERHESSESWMFRLIKSEFVPYEYDDIQPDLPDYCEWQISDGFIRLGYDSIPLIGVFAYQAE